MTTAQPASTDAAPSVDPVEVLIREARRRARRRRLGIVAAVIALVVGPTLAIVGARGPVGSNPSAASHSSTRALAASQTSRSPGMYPATLVMTRGLYSSAAVTRMRRGTRLSSAQTRSVTAISRHGRVEWGVLRWIAAPQYPVRSLDRGATWAVAGPAVASDWVGGGVYFVDRTSALSASVAALSSEAVLDLTLDGGLHWLQYLQPSDTWTYTLYSSGGRLLLRIGPASFATIPPAHSYAIYAFDAARHRWLRVRESL